ncbi:MAG: U32 family peptidase [Cyanobacteria bacterium RUI128]|nr:U32 family peptidase [Cyanobacteria bacterium RUI128]
MKTELLAPAKNIEIAKAAIDSGADAVFIGASSFGARSKAGNSISDLKEIVVYAHKFNVKVYVTVNTIIKDEEIPEVKALINELYSIDVDALIIQDMAIIKWSIEGEIPPIQLHISTQCDNRTLDKVSFFNKVGLSRTVLARELSLNKIKEIKEQNPDMELECFCHGALCVSYSGQCYLSQYIGGRSANRGECAQPCRKKYSVVDDSGKYLIKDKHVLSLKDFNVSRHIEKMVNIGVDSFKVEGRLKDINYVKNVIGYYRKLLDKYSDKTSSGSVELGFEPDIYKTFNRGYTDYFLLEGGNCFNFDSPKFIGEHIGKVLKVSKDYLEFELKKGIVLSNQDGLCFDKNGELGALVNKTVGNKVYLSNIPQNVCVGMQVFRNVDINFMKKLENALPKRLINADVVYKDYTLTITDEDNNSVSVNVTEREDAKNCEKNLENFKKAMSKYGFDGNIFKIRILNIVGELPFMPISIMNEYRRVLCDLLQKKRTYKPVRQKPLKYSEFYKSVIDYRGNVFNKDAEDFYNKCSSVVKEYAPEKSLPSDKVELMRTKHCIKYALGICKSPKKLFLIDEKGVKYPLVFDCKNCEMAIMKP